MADIASNANRIKVRITLIEEMLGASCSNPDIHDEYIASKAPDAPTRREEVRALIESDGLFEAQEKGMTVFARDDEGRPIMWDYQVKGFFKEAMKALRQVKGTATSKVKAYRQKIDNNLFVFPRQIPIDMHGGFIGSCQRPLRASTPMGERIALASSETVPEGSTLEFEIMMLGDDITPEVVDECMQYGELKGFLQWRNSGKGRFTYEVI